MNKKVMGKAGYFGKIVLMLTRTLSMSTEVSDCGSNHLVCYDVSSKNVLKKLAGKYYKLDQEDVKEDYKLVDFKNDKHLIGKKIFVRSAATCALKDCVCAKCVGETAVTNADIADGLSAFESEEITKVVNQNILSAKHLLNTNSEKVEFNSDFYRFFTIVGGEINAKMNDNEDVPNIEDYAIYVDPDDISKVEEFDEDSLYNTVISNGKFYIRNIVDSEEPDIIIQADNEKEIYITEEASAMLKAGNNLIRFADLDEDEKLFEVTIMNNELTKPLYDIMNLINRQNKDDIDDDIDSICNKFLGLVIEAKIGASVIATELIINRLIRSASNIFERPDFSKDAVEPYEILTVSKALEKNPSPMIGLSFQNLKRQVLSNELFEERNAPSYMDAYFKTEIPTTNLIKYAKYADQAVLNNYQ